MIRQENKTKNVREFTIGSHGLSFLCIIGEHINGGFLSIINWGVSTELAVGGESYNTFKIKDALIVARNIEKNKSLLPQNDDVVYDIASDISKDITPLLKEEVKVVKEERNERGQVTYRKYSTGYWKRYEYDKNGRETYYEDSTGYWEKQEFDKNGRRIYSENQDGVILDVREREPNQEPDEPDICD